MLKRDFIGVLSTLFASESSDLVFFLYNGFLVWNSIAGLPGSDNSVAVLFKRIETNLLRFSGLTRTILSRDSFSFYAATFRYILS